MDVRIIGIMLTVAVFGLTNAVAACSHAVCLHQPSRPLLLSEVLRQVEEHPKLRGAEAERQAASAKRVSKQGAFDPVITSGIDSLRYNSSSSRGKALNATTSETGIELLTRSGLKIIAGMRLNSGTVKSPLSSTGSAGEYYVGVKMPLLRGAGGINEKTAGEQQALLGESLADRNVALTRLNTLLDASLAYWEWAAAGRKQAVAQNLLRLAIVRADAVRVRAESGDLPLIDAVEADAEVERRRGAQIKANRDFSKTTFKLALYLWDTGNATDAQALLDTARLPSALPTTAPLTETDVAQAVTLALSHRPELAGIAVSQEILRLDEQLAENDRRPSLDATLAPGLDTGRKGIGETMKAGLLFSLPLYQNEATGRRDEARFKREKLRQGQVLLEQQVRTEVNDAVSAVNAAHEREEAARRELDLARRLETGERDRFTLGDSTLFLLNQRERATAETEARLIDVQAEYQQALALFRAAAAQL